MNGWRKVNPGIWVWRNGRRPVEAERRPKNDAAACKRDHRRFGLGPIGLVRRVGLGRTIRVRECAITHGPRTPVGRGQPQYEVTQVAGTTDSTRMQPRQAQGRAAVRLWRPRRKQQCRATPDSIRRLGRPFSTLCGQVHQQCGSSILEPMARAVAIGRHASQLCACGLRGIDAKLLGYYPG